MDKIYRGRGSSLKDEKVRRIRKMTRWSRKLWRCTGSCWTGLGRNGWRFNSSCRWRGGFYWNNWNWSSRGSWSCSWKFWWSSRTFWWVVWINNHFEHIFYSDEVSLGTVIPKFLMNWISLAVPFVCYFWQTKYASKSFQIASRFMFR